MLASVLRAIASGNCRKVASDFVPVSGRSSLSPANCFGRSGTPLQKELKKGFKGPRAMGGNARVAFYLVLVGGPHPFTFVVEGAARRVLLAADYENPPLQILTSGKLAPR